nr:CpsD/CapB family tyrosine-protein kinase [Oceanobacillus saliphilus]
MVLNKRLPKKHKKIQLVTYLNADSVIADQFRTIRTNLKFLMEEKKSRVFLITSPGENEGKSTTVANLAVSIAQQKEKVLLIDANLRNSMLHQVFKIQNQTGLTDVLKGAISLKQAITFTDIGKLDILTSGPDVSNPTEILGSNDMASLLHDVADMYDIVLIDSPTILKSTETRVLANQCDGAVLVLHRGKTEMDKAVEAKRILDLAHANLLGVIINEK